jgi:lysophospholipase L1-like esterase
MKTLVKLIIVISLLSMAPSDSGKISVFLVGDSTMAQKDQNRFPETGWGMKLQQFFNDKVIVKNHAVNGRSTKSFIAEGKWQKVLNDLKKGDYVFIQFGHNDEKQTDSSRFTNPFTTFRANLCRYIDETRKKGAFPVLLTPIVRRNFNEQGTLIDTHGDYPEVMRMVAKDQKVPLVDLQLKTEELVISYGPEKSKELYLWVEPGAQNYPNGVQDNTHFSPAGAEAIARLAVGEIKNQGLPLAKYLKP